ncbi:MAG: glutamyl-tRNA reductase [Betaproteobacteria bacterium]|nr:glutamyl-tRNA reductase [Betaproteobacteria bacterium]
MPLYALGLNHRTAPVEVRERIAFPADRQGEAVRALTALPGVQEAALLSTCNRTEVYWRGAEAAASGIREWLAALPAARGLALDAHLYLHADAAAARHAFRVASGLDSMVLGEPQILGQVKLAVRIAQDEGALGGPLDRLFQETFKVAKSVRSDTAIGETSVSMAAAALRLAQQVFGDLSATRLLLVGAGEMIELVATHFVARRPMGIAVANRTLDRGEALARSFHGQAMTLQQLPERLHEFDVVISCTASTLPLIGKGMVESALKQRRHKPMFMVDLAVPRDIEAEVADLDDVFLYTLDGLGRIIAQNTEKRVQAAAEGEAIVDARAQDFMRWLEGRAGVPAIQQLRAKADGYRAAELERARRRLAKGEDPAQVLEALAQGLTNKFLHHPMAALNRAEGHERDALATAIERLYPDQDEH